MRILNGTSNPINHETLTISDTAIGLTSAKYANGVFSAHVTVEDASIRFWVDGGIPTTTEGILLVAGEMVELDSAAEIAKFRAIAIASDAVLNVAYSA